MVIPLEFVFRGPRSVMMAFDRSMQRKYEQVEVGGSKTQLLESLGDPWSTESVFSRAIEYRESDFSRSELAKCVELVTWINGGNWFYCFGIDEYGRIVLKADGHS